MSLTIGFATPSLGMRSKHTLESKFQALQENGFTSCALGFGNYMAWVRARRPELPASTCRADWGDADEPNPSDDAIWEALYAEAANIKALAQSHGIALTVFQPLNWFEGWPAGSERHQWSRRKAEKWLPLCAKLGVQFLQVGSNNQPGTTTDLDSWAADLGWLADLASRLCPEVELAYEPWCFGKVVYQLEQCWELVKKVDCPNLGLCPDTAHIAGCRQYGFDPLTGEGFTDNDVAKVCRWIETLPGSKISYFELSEVLRPDPPLTKGSDFDEWHRQNGDNPPHADPIFSWAVCGRPLPLVGKDAGRGVKSEKDMGGARVVDIAMAVLKTGFKGPMMFEVFEALSMDTDDDVPSIYAKAGAIASARIKAQLAL